MPISKDNEYGATTVLKLSSKRRDNPSNVFPKCEIQVPTVNKFETVIPLVLS